MKVDGIGGWGCFGVDVGVDVGLQWQVDSVGDSVGLVVDDGVPVSLADVSEAPIKCPSGRCGSHTVLVAGGLWMRVVVMVVVVVTVVAAVFPLFPAQLANPWPFPFG